MKYKIMTMDEVGNTTAEEYEGNNDFNFFCRVYNLILADKKFSVSVVSNRFELPITDIFKSEDKVSNLKALAAFVNN